MDSFARGYFRFSHWDEVAKDFAKGKVLAQKPVVRCEVIQREGLLCPRTSLPGGISF
jgi:hypothetical protein